MHYKQYLVKAINVYKPAHAKKIFGVILCACMVSLITWLCMYRVEFIETILVMDTRKIDENQPIPGGNHIMFIESSCADKDYHPPNNTGLLLTARQACSIESTARTNPNSSVYLLYTCPVQENRIEASSEFVIRLLKYPNLRIFQIHLDDYFEGTPLELFYKSGGWDNSSWRRVQASDVLRYLILWKYGGTYLDLDNIVIRSIADLGTNFVGAESGNLVANGVLNIGMDQTGREVAAGCLNEVSTHYKGDVWGANGPALITRVMVKLCNTTQTSQMTSARCSGFTVYPRTTFYSIFYNQLDLLFDASKRNTSMQLIEDSYMVHTWNHLTAKLSVTVGSLQPFGLLAQEFCPEVYQNCGPIF